MMKVARLSVLLTPLLAWSASPVCGFAPSTPNAAFLRQRGRGGTVVVATSTTARYAAASKITTDSGLSYEELEVGSGSRPGSKDFVSVHYEGRFKVGGKVFDSSRPARDNRSAVAQGKPLQFNLGRGKVIAGWDEGVATMRVGGTRRLFVPAALAYGAAGTPDGVIPPNRDLVFDVELVSVDNNQDLVGYMFKALQVAFGTIAVNGVTLAVTGHELREYINGSLN